MLAASPHPRPASTPDPAQQHLYRQLAARLERLIRTGTLRPGERLPSIRRLHRQWEVSISTVVAALHQLEDAGLIEARPQSGYFVRVERTAVLKSARRPQPELAEPEQTRPTCRPTAVTVGELKCRLMRQISRPDVVPLGAAEPSAELLPTRAIGRIMGRLLRNRPAAVHAYEAAPGCEPMRREVARRLLDAGCAVTEDDVITTGGAIEAVALSLRACTKPGDMVAVESPTYFGMLSVLESLHLKATPIRTNPRTGVCLDELRDAFAAGRARALLISTNFSNPFGVALSDERKRQLVRLCAEYDMPIVEDDVYGDLPHTGTRPRALKAFDEDDRVMHCASVSKTISPGLRVGWVVPGRWHETVLRLKLSLTGSSGTTAHLAVAEYLAGGAYDRHLNRLRRAYRQNVEAMRRTVAEAFPADTRATKPAGGHVLWVEMPDDVDSLRLYDRAAESGISVAPGPLFAPDGASFRNCVRLNAAIPWSPRVESAVRNLGQLAHEQLHTTKSARV